MTFICRQRFGILLNFYKFPRRHYYVLGIESSCDDTAAAVVDDSGKVLGESHFSQSRIHVEAGGIIPIIASKLHCQYLKSVVDTTMENSTLDYKDLSAIAVTVKPGLILSLKAGLSYAKDLCTQYSKPMIPIHHMEAHALTGRLMEDVKFPFLTFLISGGHCILALVKSVDKFYRLGTALDETPGNALDKIARRAKLKNLSKFRGLAGGRAIETAAEDGDPFLFSFAQDVMFTQGKNCNFSFSGFLRNAFHYIEKEEKEKNVGPDEVIPNFNHLCAGVLFSMSRHICQRLEIAFHYIKMKGLLKEDEKCLIVSGGVASNKFFQKNLKAVCDKYDYRMVVPPDKLCTDNGVMIAWNGMERLKEGLPVVEPNDLPSVNAQEKCPLGEDLSHDVKEMGRHMDFKFVKLNTSFDSAMNEKSEKAAKVKNRK